MKTVLAVVAGFVALVAIIVVGVMAAAGVGIFSAHVNAFVTKENLGANVENATFNAQNRISAQQWFEQTYADIQGFQANIADAKKTYQDINSQYNLANLNGVEQECNTVVADYNANVQKITQADWVPSNLPTSIAYSTCS